MTQPRYVVATPSSGSVAGNYLGSAITPTFTRSAGSWQSRGRVYGCPGTAGIPTPPPTYPSGSNNVQKAMGGTFYSDYAPNAIFPSVYYENDAPQDKPHAPVQYLGVDVNVNPLPIAAERPRNALVADPFQAHIGGARQIFQPQVVPVWLGRNGNTNG